MAPIAAAIAASVLSFGSGNAVSAIVCDTTTVPLTVPNNIDGVYINFVTGITGTTGGGVPGFDFNPYSPGALAFFWGTGAGGVGTGTGATSSYSVLAAGVSVSAASTFVNSAQTAATPLWQAGSTGQYLGVSFPNEATAAAINYGWVQLNTTAGTGFPATINHFCFENTGLAINTGDTGVVATNFTVTPSVGTPTGTISPATPQTVASGATSTFTLTPATGFHSDTVTGTCGGTLTGNTYVTAAVTADCTVIANFAADTVVTHTVTPSVGTPSGTITPATPQTVNDGATTTFTLAADAGFHIDTVTGTCNGQLSGAVYTTAAVTADCTVIANFAANSGGGTFPPDENFDEVTAPALPTGWTGTGFTTSTVAADSAPNAAFANEFPQVSDFNLDTPAFTPLGATTLTFRHQFNLEATFDGAVLEISIAGGAFTDIITAGGSFVSGGYTGPISSSFQSPIAGRQAWNGSSGGFITTVVTLPSAATGQPTILRFRTADDSSATSTTTPIGWFIDNLHLSVATLPSVVKSFAPASVTTGSDSTLTITLTNPTTGAATLTAALVDTLPAGLTATAASALTTCTGGTGATNDAGSVTLATGAVIPANGTCTVTATVSSAASGSYVNTIAVGALQTSIGNNDTAATATLTVTGPPVAVVTPTTLDYTLAQGASGSSPINIANTGGSNLTYVVGEGTTAADGRKPTSYKTVSKLGRDLMSKSGGFTLNRNPRQSHAHVAQAPLGSTDISQMADNSQGDQGVSCNNGTTTLANSFWRRFYFSEYPGVGASTNISSVTITAGSTGPSGVPVTINLYTIPHATTVDTIPTASLTPIGSGTGTIDSGVVAATIPVTGSVADTAGLDLVVEYHVDPIATGAFFPGANATPQTHPNFLSAADCGVPDPVTADSIGFPDDHLTMVVTLGGTPPATCANPADIPWLSEAPAGGTVAPGANANVSVTANATGLAVGSYSANVCVSTNDTANPLVTIPVTLTVTQGVVLPCSGGTDEIFCDGFEGPGGGGGPGVYQDRTTFLTHVATGFYENPFDDAVPGASPPLTYTSGGWAYTVDASSAAPTGGLYNDTGIISTNLAADSIVVTFTGDPVSAVGGNFWATDISVQPTGTDITITLSDATTETFTSTGPTDFRGFTTAAPITTITIDAPDGASPDWPTLDNLIIGTSN